MLVLGLVPVQVPGLVQVLSVGEGVMTIGYRVLPLHSLRRRRQTAPIGDRVPPPQLNCAGFL